LIYENLQRIASRASDLTVFQNRQDAEQFITHGTVPSTKSTVIPGSGVRTDLFDPEAFTPLDRNRIRAELAIKQDNLLVTMVSRIIRSKGVNEFADAAQIVTSRNSGIDFLLVGPRDDDSRDRLLPEEVEQLGTRVNWVGPRADIPAILAASDVFVLPSFYREGIPRVLLEAASMSLPIITTDSPGCNDIVEHGLNGLLVPMKDSKALAKAIQCLLDNADIRYRFGRESRQRALSRFSLAMIANQTRSLYINLLARKGVAVAAAKW
jgi:glycosyltransferase involved in cell wall biosynthesis